MPETVKVWQGPLMSDDPWGIDTPPAVAADALPPLPPRLADLAELEARGERRLLQPGEEFHFVGAADLPEVQALAADGWHPASNYPWDYCLPAVWPAQHRCWVPDRLPQIGSASCVGSDGEERQWLVPGDVEDHDEFELSKAWAAEECGLPAPPAGRLWLLRSPWPALGLAVVLHLIHRLRAEQHPDQGHSDEGCGETTRAAIELLTWDEEQVWAWWRGPEADTAQAWRRAGRVGDDVADLVLVCLDPANTARLLAPAADGGAGLTEEQAAAWARTTGTRGSAAVEATLAWRAQGLPADPPEALHWELDGLTPAEYGEWIGAGFTFDDILIWRRRPLQVAVRWREAGFALADARELVMADQAVTPPEADAFDDAGIDPRARLTWLATGFTAAEARAWTDLDVYPHEARVWRAFGMTLDDAREHRAAGGGPLPPDRELAWIGRRDDRPARVYGVIDPPGTRGSVAARADDPFFGRPRPRR